MKQWIDEDHFGLLVTLQVWGIHTAFSMVLVYLFFRRSLVSISFDLKSFLSGSCILRKGSQIFFFFSSYLLEESCTRMWIEQKQNMKGRAIDVEGMGRICTGK